MAAQLLSTIHSSLQKLHLDTSIPGFINNLRLKETVVIDTLEQVVSALYKFFYNLTKESPTEWQQCLQCLQVSHTTVIEKHQFAQLLTYNQHANTIRTSLLNSIVQKYHTKTVDQMERQKQHAFNQMIEEIINSNPLLFKADVRVQQ